MTMQIGFVGLGNMGKYMAANLAKSLASQNGAKLIVWNRTASKTHEMTSDSQGAAVAADSLAQLAERCDVVFSSLGSDAAVEAVIAEMLDVVKTKRGGKKTIFCETSTIYPELTKKLNKQVTEAGIEYVQALPFGQPPVAKSAQLVFAVAGKPEARRVCDALITPAMGRKIMEFGEDPAKASAFKLVGNSMILSTVEMIAETMTLAEKSGIGSDRVLEWIHDFYPAMPVINYGKKIADLKFEAAGGFDLVGGLKDANHIHKLGEQYGCPTHIVDTAIKHIKGAQAANEGQDNKDWAALVGAQRIESGLPPFSK